VNSAIYTGRVRHRRFKPTGNAFSYTVCLYYLDLSEVEKLFRWPALASRSGFSLSAFRRKDYLGDATLSLDEAVRQHVESETGQRPRGPIRLLTQIAYLGYCFNPVSFYYCFDRAGTRVEYIVADITNTPWNERHAYVLTCTGKEPMEHFSFSKIFHVSPFMDMNLSYDWLFSAPDKKLLVHMENFIPGESERFFDATLTLERQSFTAFHFFKSLVLYPFMTFKTVAMIYWQALKLWMKKVPFHPHTIKGVVS
jgi:DUF1365 family protein